MNHTRGWSALVSHMGLCTGRSAIPPSRMDHTGIQDGNNKSKNMLVLKKQRCCWANARVETYKIVVVVNAAWVKSFAWVECNKKAIAVRGWNPLTRNLLDHPEIAETKENHQENSHRDSSHQDSSATIASTLNFGTGVANKVMVDILQIKTAKMEGPRFVRINSKVSKHWRLYSNAKSYRLVGTGDAGY
jgi:hypothetical protein